MGATRLNSPTKLTRTLLWRNPSPNQVFAAQTVQMPNMTGYDEVWVYAKGYYNYGNGSLHKLVTRVGSNRSMSWAFAEPPNAFIWCRAVEIYNAEINFHDSYTKNLLNTSVAYKENERMVPYEVYGVNYS